MGTRALVADLGRAVCAPAALMRDARDRDSLRAPIVAVVTVSLAWVVCARVLALAITLLKAGPGASLDVADYVIRSLVSLASVPAIALAMTALVAGIVHVLAWVARGRARYRTTFAVCAYSAIPLYVVTLVATAVMAARPALEEAAYRASLVGCLWVIGVVIVGLRECHSLRPVRACAAMALPVAFVVIALVKGLPPTR